MSDKLHSIPKEAIHVTPKEFSRPELETGNVVIRLNGLGVPLPGADDFDDPVPELEDDPVPVCDEVEADVTNDLSTVKVGVDVGPCENFPTLNVVPNFVDSNELASPLESDVPSLHLNDVGNDADGPKVDASFGNFADFEASSSNLDWAVPEVGNKVEPSGDFEAAAAAVAGAEGRVPEFDDDEDDDDDDFGDFDSADVVATSSMVATSMAPCPGFNRKDSASKPKLLMCSRGSKLSLSSTTPSP